jgi:hypothetical protein
VLLPGLQDGTISRGDGLHQYDSAEQVTGSQQLANIDSASLIHGSPETMKTSDVHVEWGYEVVDLLRGRIGMQGLGYEVVDLLRGRIGMQG